MRSDQGHTHDSPWWAVSRVGQEQRGLHQRCGDMSCLHVPVITSVLDSPRSIEAEFMKRNDKQVSWTSSENILSMP